ncbi:hypothetical protein [Desulfosediminicola flagellatus]|uniref:hypothetical protein n=1 Tax=Desulfosediminicola flagellatus TaxID=2569541 RepID=UPI0010AC044A|nr:hypothetical protein [Desulfosediminicola flagellatus]
MAEVKKKKKQFDWELIEREYRTNMYSDAELARRHGCSRTAIQKHAKTGKWARDLSSAVRQAANAKLVQVDAQVAGCYTMLDSEAIDRASSTRVEVIKSHRKDINRLRDLESRMVSDLGDCPQKTYITQFQGQIIKQDVMIAITERATALNNLVNVMHRRIQLERQAFNIKDADDSDEKKSNPLLEIIESIDGTSKGLPVFDGE